MRVRVRSWPGVRGGIGGGGSRAALSGATTTEGGKVLHALGGAEAAVGAPWCGAGKGSDTIMDTLVFSFQLTWGILAS